MKKIEGYDIGVKQATFVEFENDMVFTLPCETVLVSWKSEDYHRRVVHGIETSAVGYAKIYSQALPDGDFAPVHLIEKPYFDKERCLDCAHKNFDKCKIQPTVLAIKREIRKLSR